MKYLISVIDDQSNSASGDEMAAIDVFNDRLQSEGHWVFAGGLGSPSNATEGSQACNRKVEIRPFLG